MTWTTAFVVLTVVIVAYWLKRAGQISRKQAQSHLENGALLIDVRSPSEFRSRHLPNAINLPLDQIETMLPQRVRDKHQLLLLHCESGMRSGAAKKKLKDMGYLHAFNLGSYARAAQVVSGE
jgi:phage shock protein E